jgi:hypothetical protein
MLQVSVKNLKPGDILISKRNPPNTIVIFVEPIICIRENGWYEVFAYSKGGFNGSIFLKHITFTVYEDTIFNVERLEEVFHVDPEEGPLFE